MTVHTRVLDYVKRMLHSSEIILTQGTVVHRLRLRPKSGKWMELNRQKITGTCGRPRTIRMASDASKGLYNGRRVPRSVADVMEHPERSLVRK
jgi:hypothetical protein